MTAIAAELLAAYRETEYHVGGASPFVLHIGRASPALLQLQARLLVHCSAFLTAVNPRSQCCNTDVNAARQRALAAQLGALGLPLITGYGKHPGNDWPAEPSFLVPGLSLSKAQAVARQWEQNALVFCAADAIPRLVLSGCG